METDGEGETRIRAAMPLRLVRRKLTLYKYP